MTRRAIRRSVIIRLSTPILCALWLVLTSPLVQLAAAMPAEPPAGLEAEKARKLDPILWRALAAHDAAARGTAPVGAAQWLGLTASAKSAASEAGPTVDLLIRLDDAAATGNAVLQA